MSKIIRLHYFDTFEIIQGHRRFTKIGFEAEMDDEFEDVRDVFYKLKRKSEELFYEAKGAEEKKEKLPFESSETQASPKSQEETIIEGINSCKEMNMLLTYSLIVKNHPQFKDVYDTKMEQLKNE